MAGVATGGGGISGQGGAAGPAKSGLSSSIRFGGNAGIGNRNGLNLQTVAVIGIVVIVALFVLTKVVK